MTVTALRYFFLTHYCGQLLCPVMSFHKELYENTFTVLLKVRLSHFMLWTALTRAKGAQVYDI